MSAFASPLKFVALGVVAALVGCAASMALAQELNVIHQPYLLDTGLVSRSISFENPSGEPGKGGQAASNLGVGRKGAPAKQIAAGETVQLCDIANGPGTLRHIWMTTEPNPRNLRSLVVRAWWDDQEHPSIQCPVGDLFGFAHGKVMPYFSAVHSVGTSAGMNLWLPMPFAKRVKVTLTNEGEKTIPLYYQIDYTLGDKHAADVGRLHVLFRRENPTTEKRDFELLPQRHQKGRYIGAVIGIRNLHPGKWWGEGEIKVYIDGDKDFPTICGTGSEDYIGLSWGTQQTPFFYNGCSLDKDDYVSMYRWHLPDPIGWQREARITIQQIAYNDPLDRLEETQDDWSAAAFWYEPVPSAPLPPLPDRKARIADIWPEK